MDKAIFRHPADTPLDIDFFDINCHKSLYHYTSPEGLLGILQSDKIVLWFSKYDCLNDSSEGIHIIDIYKNTLKDLLDAKEIDQSFYDTICKCEPSAYKSFRNPSIKRVVFFTPFDTYICCFSSNPDSINMWRYYIKNNTCNGFCIDFIPQLFNSIGNIPTSSVSQESRLELREVVYDDNDKIKILKAQILHLSKQKISVQNQIQNLMSQFLLECQFFFKHKCFESENEIRAIYYVPQADTKEKKPTLKYRTNAGIIVPYFEVKIPKKHLQSIKLAPLMSDSAKNSVDSYLINNGYTNCGVDKSKLPIRY